MIQTKVETQRHPFYYIQSNGIQENIDYVLIRLHLKRT